MSSKIQAVLFDKNYYDIGSSKIWLIAHSLYPIKPPHITKHKIRYRLENPKIFKKFITKKPSKGVDLIIGYLY